MKFYTFFVFLLVNTIIYGQTFKGIVVDSLTSKPVAYATLNIDITNKGTYCNEFGEFSLKSEIDKKTILIQCLGYEKKSINISDLKSNKTNIIKLYPKQNIIEEIIVISSKKKYSNSKKIITPKKIKIRSCIPFGVEFSTLVKNKYKKEGKMQSISLSLNECDDCDYYATYNIKFYEYDSIKKMPGEILYDKNVIIKPENKTYNLKIQLDSLNIEFPKNGICIGVEIMNFDYTEKINSMSKIGPKINFTHTKQEILTWQRFFNKNWSIYTRKSNIRKDFQNGMINAEVKIEK